MKTKTELTFDEIEALGRQTIIGTKNKKEWDACATDKDKARLDGFVFGYQKGIESCK